jgi:hypothetical protein
MLGRPWIIVVLGVVTLLALFAARRGPDERHAYAQCLTSAECLKDEVCAVTPKDDGFATLGTCTNACTDTAQCLNGWKCVPFVDTGAFLVPPGTKEAKAAKGPARTVCAPPVH